MLHTFIFSPTGTSRKVAQAVAQGLGTTEIRQNDLTWQAAPKMHLSDADVALFAVPVYGGKVAPAAIRRIEALSAEGTPAVLVVVYGNRSFGSALKELSTAVQSRGFIPIAAGAFIGEHSYSTPLYPIAEGRPSVDDLTQAEAFGRAVAGRLASTPHPTAIDVQRVKQPGSGLLSLVRFICFVIRYRHNQKRHPIVRIPKTDPARCTHCSRCVSLCPTAAIVAGEELHTDPTRCIRCCACVKGCPLHARTYETPFTQALSQNFARPKANIFYPKQ